MPDTLILTGTKPANITVPIGTDKRKAISVRTPLQQLADWAAYLDTRIGLMLTGALSFTTLSANNAVVTVKMASGQVESVTGKFSGLLEALANFKVTGTATFEDNLLAPVSGSNLLPFRIEAKTQGTQGISRNTFTRINPSGTSDFNLTIAGDGQRNGDWVSVFYLGTGNCLIKAPDGTTTVAGLNGSTGYYAMLGLIGGTWQVIA